jgi:hypothetical protein
MTALLSATVEIEALSESPSRRQERDRSQRPWTSAEWVAYYRSNAEALLPLPWERGAELTAAECRAVAASIQDFQLGESSEGANLMRAADAYARRSGDHRYSEAMTLFIREEQRHAGVLGCFLDAAGIPRLERSRLDSVFRWMRRLAGLELFLCVLMTAELIGKVYYRALYHATGSPLLRRLCAQLLRDEIQHLRFHAERLASMRRRRRPLAMALTRLGHRLFLAGTCLAVWPKHRNALRAGGYTFGRFRRDCGRAMQLALTAMEPSNYDFARTH